MSDRREHKGEKLWGEIAPLRFGDRVFQYGRGNSNKVIGHGSLFPLMCARAGNQKYGKKCKGLLGLFPGVLPGHYDPYNETWARLQGGKVDG